MTDPKLTKLRLTYERLQRNFDARQAALNEFKTQVSAAKNAYCTKARELGICPGCLKEKADCVCVPLSMEFSSITFTEFAKGLTGGWIDYEGKPL
jgi:hypothetical protein